MKIQYNRNRYYDYYTGRWLTHDPAGYIDGMSLYEYARSNPALRIDPYGLSRYTFGTSPPPWGRSDTWEELEESHGSNEMDEEEIELATNIALRTYIMINTMNVYERSRRLGLWYLPSVRNFADLLEHYTSNTGKAVTINYAEMIDESSGAMAYFKSELADAVKFVDDDWSDFLVLPKNIVTEKEKDDTIEALDSLDWFLSIHVYTTWAQGKAVCDCYKCKMDWTIHLRDIFDWNIEDTDPFMGIFLSQAELALMHHWGAFRAFKVHGSCTTTVVWPIGRPSRAVYKPCKEMDVRLMHEGSRCLGVPQ